MAAIRSRIEELQRELLEHEVAQREQARQDVIATGSIEELEGFCRISDKVLAQRGITGGGKVARLLDI